jgi:hypothetical protein
MTEAKQQEAGRTRFLLLPPLSATEREAERESEPKLRVVLVEMLKLVAEKPELSAEAADLRARVGATEMVNAAPSMSYGRGFSAGATRGHNRNRNYDCGGNSRSIRRRIETSASCYGLGERGEMV